MEVLINISEDTYNRIKSGNYTTNPELGFAIQDGIVLSNGHGDLKDVNVLKKSFEKWWGCDDIPATIVEDLIDGTPSVIEANKGRK